MLARKKVFSKLIFTIIFCTAIVLSSGANTANVTVVNNTKPIDNNGISNNTVDKTHSSREQVTQHEENVKAIDNNKTVNSTIIKLSDDAKKYEATFPNTTGNDDKASKPRKGVTLSSDPPPIVVNNTISSVVANTTKNSTVAVKTTVKSTVKPTTKKIIKKPLFTEHIEKPIVKEKSKEDLDDDIIINSGSNNKNHRDTNQADYIIPIVAVILSVPLVAIAMAYLYKRGADWYQHRNYRRMDFLIEGMYNN